MLRGKGMKHASCFQIIHKRRTCASIERKHLAKLTYVEESDKISLALEIF